MIVEILNGVGQPVTLPATQVIVRGEQGTPLCVAAEYGAAVFVSHVNDAKFAQVLQNLGLGRVVVEPLPLKTAEALLPPLPC